VGDPWAGSLSGRADGLSVEIHPVATSITDSACLGRSFADVEGVRVRVRRLDGSEGPMEGTPLIDLNSSRRPQPRASASAEEAVPLARLLLGQGVGPGVSLVTMPLTDGVASNSLIASGDACIPLETIAPGRHRVSVVADGDQRLIDRAHRIDDELIRTFSVLEGPARVQWDLERAAAVTVDVDAVGARLPDRSSAGGLAWLVRGDEYREARAIGESRHLHPGQQTLVVSACRNPEAPASMASVVIEAGGELHQSIALATVIVENVAAWPDLTLALVRTTACADGADRPSLRWDAGLHDGMRIALPHGQWEARLETSSGSGFSSPVLVSAGSGPTTVALT